MKDAQRGFCISRTHSIELQLRRAPISNEFRIGEFGRSFVKFRKSCHLFFSFSASDKALVRGHQLTVCPITVEDISQLQHSGRFDRNE